MFEWKTEILALIHRDTQRAPHPQQWSLETHAVKEYKVLIKKMS